MNEATKELTLSDFQQQVAEQYGMKDWDDLTGQFFESSHAYYKEAAEAYAAYRFEQGAIQGFKNGYGSCGSHLEKSFNDGFEQGKQEGEAKYEKLLSWLKSKSVYTLLRCGVKSPSSSGMDDCEDSDYYDLYNFVNELKQEEE